MKNTSLLSLAAVLTASLTWVIGSSVLYSVVSCVFLLLIAAGDYGPKRHRAGRHVAENQIMDTRAASRQRYRLAA